ncbi:MAG: response regulator [Thermoguttaceae bacterium]|nr:response regulator [Thermoguttaceae bacterium]MDW8039021.1 response regulator [Thermoguttaceae bacterium]
MSKRVLLCDDEIAILRAAEFKLKKAGYQVHIAPDGQAGWELMERMGVDMVITDCQMPRMNGLQLVERIRSEPRWQQLPIVMLTAKGFELRPEELKQRWNVLAVLPKPFSPRELLQLVNRILGDEVAPGLCSEPTAASGSNSAQLSLLPDLSSFSPMESA